MASSEAPDSSDASRRPDMLGPGLGLSRIPDVLADLDPLAWTLIVALFLHVAAFAIARGDTGGEAAKPARDTHAHLDIILFDEPPPDAEAAPDQIAAISNQDRAGDSTRPVPREAPQAQGAPPMPSPPNAGAGRDGAPAMAAQQMPDRILLSLATPQLRDQQLVRAQRQEEMAALAADIAAHRERRLDRSRRKVIDASTRATVDARYRDTWQRQVERVGNINYPAAAVEQGLSGSLLLRVSIRADGAIEGIDVLRSSGYSVLDQAAANIVRLAGPFPAFPQALRAEADVIDIIRTWEFTSGHRLR